MASIFDITGNDIFQLNDTDLRVLIGYLCEQDYRCVGLATIGVRAGGDQNAPDGGYDVVIDQSFKPPKRSPFHTSFVGIQVKTTNMTVSKIRAEMKPKGQIRSIFEKLAKKNGSYVIVSSKASTTESEHSKRINTMKGVFCEAGFADKISVHFFDGNAVAQWVRNHPSLIVWVRDKIGKRLEGWLPWGNWAKVPDIENEEFLLNDQIRIRLQDDEEQNTLQAIDSIRRILNIQKSCTRLIGLSGVGKTRFVQALFDKSIGTSEVDPINVVYTDLSNSPGTSPQMMMDTLVEQSCRIVMVVDNCDPDLHSILTRRCKQTDSRVSLLTIEYDVRNAEPAETNVILMESANPDLIESFIKNRYPNVNQVDRITIAKMSDGNFRIAEAIASTIKKRQSISLLNDEVIFKRLFLQRNDVDPLLEKTARVCSLLYSFDGVNISGENAELPLLGEIAGIAPNILYENVNELKERKLIQKRSNWRAVLPHALANRFAITCLKGIPVSTIENAIMRSNSKRVIRSFSKRLSYLHGSEEAVTIAEKWLGPEGYLGKEACNFNEFGMDLFNNVASLSPEAVLEAIERGFDQNPEFVAISNENQVTFAKILHHVAYDTELFERSVNILIRMSLLEDKTQSGTKPSDYLEMLFYIAKSGTYAEPCLRKSMLLNLVLHSKSEQVKLGFRLLKASLDYRLNIVSDYCFGARQRDKGLYPNSAEEKDSWFQLFLSTYDSIKGDSAKCIQFKVVLSDVFRGLWRRESIRPTLKSITESLADKDVWPEGLACIKSILKFDGDSLESKTQLKELIKALTPKTFEQRLRTYVLYDGNFANDLLDDVENDNCESIGDSFERLNAIAFELGKECGETDKNHVINFLELFITSRSYQVAVFADGFAQYCDDVNSVWANILAEFSKLPEEKRAQNFMCGFVCGLRNKNHVFQKKVLDQLVHDPALGTLFPIIQLASGVDSEAIERLIQSIELGVAPARSYHDIAYGNRHLKVDDDKLIEFLTKIRKIQDGDEVVILVLYYRVYYAKIDGLVVSDLLRVFTVNYLCEIIENSTHCMNVRNEQWVADITSVCLDSVGGDHDADRLCKSLFPTLSDSRNVGDYSHLLTVLAKKYSLVFLNNLEHLGVEVKLGNDRYFAPDTRLYESPIDAIDEDILLAWCRINPESRFKLIANVTFPFSRSKESGNLEWKNIIKIMLVEAHNLDEILRCLELTFSPKSWSDSLSTILETRIPLTVSLIESGNSVVKEWGERLANNLKNRITVEIRRESERGAKFERFE